MRTHRQPAAPLALTVALSALAACGPAASPPPAPPPPTVKALMPPAPQGLPVVETKLESVGLDEAALDRSANPCEDFYQFACGGWLAKTEIPGDEASWMRSFNEIEKRNEAELRRILEDAASAGDRDPVTRKIGAYYGACMDEPAVEAAGAKPVADLLAKARRVRDPKGLGALVTELHRRRIWALFDIESAQDMKDATRVIAQLDQNGLGLPDRDYYLGEDDKSKALRKTYEEHVARMMRLAGAAGGSGKGGGARRDADRDRAREDLEDAGRAAGPDGPLQQARPGGAREGRAGVLVGRVFPGARPPGRQGGQRRPPCRFFEGLSRAAHVGEARRVAELPFVARGALHGARAAQGVRRRELRAAGRAHRAEGGAAALEALRGRDRQRARRAARAAVRQDELPRREQARGRGDGAPDQRRVRAQRPGARLDG